MSSLLAHYESFLINNVSTISTLESSLRSITWFLPGRFKDAELASEALATVLNTMSLYHDTLLARIVRSEPKYRPLIPSSSHSRYTRAWSEKDGRYKWAARVLELIHFAQLVIEMGLARKASRKNKWRGIVLLEIIKASLRLLLLRITRRPLLSPPIPEREFDPGSLPPPSNASSPTLAPSSRASSPPSTPEHLRNNHVSLSETHPLLTPPPPLRSPSPVKDYLLPKALTTSSVKVPTHLMKYLITPKEWLSEVVYVLRPLIYAFMLSSKRYSNRALVTALIMEFTSRNLRRTPSPSSSLERGEYARRDRDLLWYLFRGSIWEEYTRPKLESIADSTARAPFLGLVSALIKDWIPLIDQYYHYTAP